MMSVWLTMLKKDIRMLKNQWFGFMGAAIVVTGAVLAAHSLGILNADRTAVIIGLILTGSLVVVFPAQVFKGMNKEVKGAAALWLQTPQSGWAMFGSKLVSSLIGSLLYFIVSYGLALALFHSVNFAHVLPPIHYQTHIHGGGFTSTTNGAPTNLSPAVLSVLATQIPRLEFFAMAFLLCAGIYLALWIALIHMSVRAVKNQLKHFSWVVGLGIVLIATWGVGGLKSTALYAQAFGWGRVALLRLFPPHVRALLGGYWPESIFMGHFVFDIIVVLLLFAVTGLLIDRYVEV